MKQLRMAEDGEDWKELKMMILKSLAIFLKIHKQWHSSFKFENDLIESILSDIMVS